MGASRRKSDPTTSTPGSASDFCEGHAQPGIEGITLLIPEIGPSPTMIYVRRTDPVGQPAQQVKLLEGGVFRSHDTEPLGHRILCGTNGLAHAADHGLKRGFPVTDFPGVLALDHWRLQAIIAVHRWIAEPVPIADPGLIDIFTVARHDAHQFPATHVTVQIAAHGVMR